MNLVGAMSFIIFYSGLRRTLAALYITECRFMYNPCFNLWASLFMLE